MLNETHISVLDNFYNVTKIQKKKSGMNTQVKHNNLFMVS